jgi:hypothetical protein
MKKFSNITGEKVGIEPKQEIKITEADVFKAKIIRLMDDFLKVQMYGPITRYHVAGTMKVVGQELFLEALMDLLDDKSNKDKVKLLESLKLKVQDWKMIDETIEEIESHPTGLYKHKLSIKNIYNKYKSDEELLVEKTEKSANKIKSSDNAFLRYKACESLLNDSEFNTDLIKKMSEKYLNRLNQLNESNSII